MKLSASINLKQSLKLQQILTPKLIQMFKLFQCSYPELLETLEQESNQNVLIEVTQFDQLSNWTVRKQHQYDPKDVTDYAMSPTKTSLYENLLSQVRLLHLSEKETMIAQDLIEEINSEGYLTQFPSVVEQIQKKRHVSARKVGDVLKIIQSLEPDGVGARSLKECLLIQVEHYDFESSELRSMLKQVIQNHLQDLGNKAYKKIALSCGLDLAGVKAIESFIKQNLNPNPAKNFSSSHFTQHIVPSFEVEMQGHAIRLRNLEQEKGIQIGVSEHYEKILNDPKTDDQTRLFLQKKLQKAKEWVQHLKDRHQNLERLASYVINIQHLFVEKGPLFLVPLLQKDVSNYLGVSNSTVSRIVSYKFIQTPHGLFSLKQLCPRNHFGKTKVQLQNLIQELIQTNPLSSDQKIKNYLAEQGILIARRTIAKYRQNLGIGSSFKRKRSKLKEN